MVNRASVTAKFVNVSALALQRMYMFHLSACSALPEIHNIIAQLYCIISILQHARSECNSAPATPAANGAAGHDSGHVQS
jgi:hypothetical protein